MRIYGCKDMLVAMVREGRRTGMWLEIDGKMYAPAEVEQNLARFEDLKEEKIRLRDPLAVLHQADHSIAAIVLNLHKRRQEYVEKLLKYGVLKK